MGLDADQSLNCARETAWTIIRDMKPVDINRAKRQKFLEDKNAGPPSSSSTGWY
jgi:hypothetical protein